MSRSTTSFGCLLSCVLAGSVLVGCSSDGDDDGTTPPTVDAKPAALTYAGLVHRNYQDALAKAEALRTAVDAFVAAPSDATLEAAKTAWKDSRPVYLQSEVYRFYGGPIDDEDSGPEGRLNGWPLDELYIDYVDGEPMAGIINRPADFPTIDKALIAEQNEKDGEKNLSSGYHAIEFLLWGQDLSETGPGERPATDYVSDGAGTAENQDRRGTYLRAAAELLVDDLGLVTDAWAPGQQNYAATFVADDPLASLTKMITGMGSLAGAELAKERMNNAFETKDQEEEHSCFSDNTDVDHLNDAIGIQNVYLGRYGAEDGPGIDELVRATNPDLDTRMQADLQAAIDSIDAIPEPFDQAILDDAGRAAVQAAMDALTKLTDTTVEVATALGVTINLE